MTDTPRQEVIPAGVLTGSTIGRPLSYTDAIADAICERLMNDEALSTIVKDEGMPGLSTVYRWLDDVPGFREKYVRAREYQGHTVADKIATYRQKTESGEMKPDQAKAAADMAKWEASRRAPKMFGDKLQVETRTRNANVTISDDDQEAARQYADFMRD